MPGTDIKKITDGWIGVSPFVFVPHTEEQYCQLVDLLDNLIDEVGEDETHPLASLMDIPGTLIEKYEEDYTFNREEIHERTDYSCKN